MHVMLCRAAGAGKLISDRRAQERLERARSLGSDVVLNPLAGRCRGARAAAKRMARVPTS